MPRLIVNDGHIIGAQPLVTDQAPLVGTATVGGGDLLLLETGGTDNLLLETGDNLLLES